MSEQKQGSDIIQMMVRRPCPACNTDIVLGVGLQAPVATFCWTAAAIDERKQDVIKAIDAANLLTDEEKNAAKASLPPALDPVQAEAYIRNIKEQYTKPVEAPKKAAKKK